MYPGGAWRSVSDSASHAGGRRNARWWSRRKPCARRRVVVMYRGRGRVAMPGDPHRAVAFVDFDLVDAGGFEQLDELLHLADVHAQSLSLDRPDWKPPPGMPSGIPWARARRSLPPRRRTDRNDAGMVRADGCSRYGFSTNGSPVARNASRIATLVCVNAPGLMMAQSVPVRGAWWMRSTSSCSALLWKHSIRCPSRSASAVSSDSMSARVVWP